MKFDTYFILRGLRFGAVIFERNFVLVSRGLIFGGAYIRDFTVSS